MYEQFPFEEQEKVAYLASVLNFTDVTAYDRGDESNVVVFARWRGAPVAISLRGGLAGGVSVAFYNGPQDEPDDADAVPPETWHEVADSRFGFGPDAISMALTLGEAMLTVFANDDLVHARQQVPMPPGGATPALPGNPLDVAVRVGPGNGVPPNEIAQRRVNEFWCGTA